MVKPENVLRGETTNRHTAFKITIRGHFHKEIFSFLDRMILSFFFGPVFFSFSLYHGLSSPFDLHEQRFFHEQKFHV